MSQFIREARALSAACCAWCYVGLCRGAHAAGVAAAAQISWWWTDLCRDVHAAGVVLAMQISQLQLAIVMKIKQWQRSSAAWTRHLCASVAAKIEDLYRRGVAGVWGLWGWSLAYLNKTARNFQRSYLRLAAPRTTWVFVGASTAASIVLAMAFGYFIGAGWERTVLRAQWQDKIDEQQQLLAEDSAAWNAELALLAKKVGLFEARLTRLDVLGSQLVDFYGLDQEEFSFLNDPGIGGATAVDHNVHDLRMMSLVNALDARIKARELQLSILKEVIGKDELAKGMQPLGWPVSKGWLSSKFGYRISPFSGRREYHSGVDIAGAEGTPVYAVASGVVKYARKFKSYGNMVELDHGNKYSTRYGHNQINLVTEGQTVKQGDVIALLGSTGRSTGPHLHFEVLKSGRQINPGKYLLSR